MELRNTPRADGKSPAEILFGAPTRTKLPLHRSQLSKDLGLASWKRDQRAEVLREKARARFDASAKPLSPLSTGDIVLVQDPRNHRWNLVAEVVEVHPRSRSYLVRTESGRLFRRNRRFLRRFVPPQNAPALETPEKPVLRRSYRKRRAPTRFAHSVQLSPRSSSKGGHEVSSSIMIPPSPDAAFLPCNASLSLASANGNPPQQPHAILMKMMQARSHLPPSIQSFSF